MRPPSVAWKRNGYTAGKRYWGASRFACQRRYGGFDLDAAANGSLKCLHRKRCTGGLDRGHVQSVVWGCMWVEDDCCAVCLRRDLLEHLYPFSSDFGLENREASDVAARPNQGLDQSLGNGVSNRGEYDGCGLRLLPDCIDRWSAHSQDHVGVEPDQFLRKFLYLLDVAAGPANVDLDVEAIGPAERRKALHKCFNPRLSFGIAL